MKPRVLKTYKILAVAITAATAGCNKAVVPDPSTEPTAEAITQQAPAPSSAEPGHATEAPSPQVTAAPPPERPASNDPALLALRAELKAAGREAVFAKVAHFRPLCDKDGYPLVGNLVMGKGDNHEGYQPSAFCDEVRKKGQR